jgi:diadenosine tetraphosphate (Ap4A) HIT family hydrolase
VHEPHGGVLLGKLYVTLQRHAESLGELDEVEVAELGPLVRAVVAALEAERAPARVHLGSYGEEVRHVHLHVTPRPAAWPRGNVPAALTQAALAALVRLRLRRPVEAAAVDDVVAGLRTRLATIRP